jgi:hypothetical protein
VSASQESITQEQATAGIATPGITAGAALAALGRRLRPRLPSLPAGWGQVFRTLLAFTLALYIAYALELESASSAGMTVLIVASGSRGAVLSKSLYRALGTVVGAVVSVVLVAWFAQAPWLFILSFALWLGLCTFLASLLRYFRSYGAVLSGYTIALIALAAVQDPGNVFHLATARIAVVTLGVSITALVFLLTDTGPARPRCWPASPASWRRWAAWCGRPWRRKTSQRCVPPAARWRAS